MTFLLWHYSEGIELFVNKWIRYQEWIIHYFSLSLLLRTLFAPWKRLVVEEKSTGFSPSRIFENFMFNLISRGMGFIVRITVFYVGVVAIIFTFLASALGIFLWIIFPPLGYSMYKRKYRTPIEVTRKLENEMLQSKENAIKVFLSSDVGLFLIAHLGIEKKELLTSTDNGVDIEFDGLPSKSMQSFVEELIKKNVWTNERLRKIGLDVNDLIYAAYWWDLVRKEETFDDDSYLGRPGIALELLYGYTPILNKYSTDLTAPKDYSHHLIGREQIVLRMERVLNGGSSLVLVGSPGVGKRTVVLEFARRASLGMLGPKMSYRRILELDYNSLLSGSSDLNSKKSEFSNALKEAAYAGNIILMIRDIHRITNKEVEGFDFTDVFEELLDKRDLKIMAVTTPSEYEKYIVPNMRLRKYFENVEVIEPNKDEAMRILIEFAKGLEKMRGIITTTPAMDKLLVESDRFISETPFPEKALELLDAACLNKESQNNGNIINVDDINTILAEKTGVSFTRLTHAEKKQLGNLEELIHERLVNQNNAVNLISRSLRARTVGIAKENKPLGSFLFLGPTGVGKTQTAKVLSKVYYGSENSILRFDMAEYSGREGLERLIGSTERNQPGSLTTAIKNKPASLLLLDEIEKASPEIFNLFLSLLDEGSMKDAFDKKINGKNLFIIGTSNAGAEYIRQLVSKGVTGENLQKEVVEHVLKERIFSPEFINRFDAVVVYEPLTVEHLEKIAQLLLGELGENLKSKGLKLEITKDAIKKVAEDGYDPAFGARPMERVINLVIGDILGKALLSGEVKEGDTLRIVPQSGKENYSLETIK